MKGYRRFLQHKLWKHLLKIIYDIPFKAFVSFNKNERIIEDISNYSYFIDNNRLWNSK